MFENLDQDKEQNLTGTKSSSMPGGVTIPPTFPGGNRGIPAPAPVEDMFAGVKDAAATAKVPGAAPMAEAKISAGPVEKSSGKAWGIILTIIIILLIIGLGIFIAAKFLGVEITNPTSWSNKLSSLSSLFVKQSGQTVVINNQTPAPETDQNNVPPATTPAATPAVSSTPVVAAPMIPAATTTAPGASSTSSSLTASSTLDSDGDGLTDYDEINIYHTNPNQADSDNDGLTDYQEVKIYHTDPNNPDTDGDGFTDGSEVQNGYNPLGPGKLPSSEAMTVYKNATLGFQISVPLSWILPKDNTSNPEFFSTVACSKQPNFFTCPSFKIVLSDEYGDEPDVEFKLLSSDNPVKLTSLIAGAIVIESGNSDKPSANDDSTSWDQGYDVYFPTEQKHFVIYAPDRGLENSILSTFKLLK